MTNNTNTSFDTMHEKLSYNFLTDKEEDIIIEESQIDYDGIIYLDKKDFSIYSLKDFVEKSEDEEVSFYCKICKKIITEENITHEKSITKKKKQNHLVCNICKKAEIIIGTTRGIQEHFHLK